MTDAELAFRNRRIIAGRTSWPDGVLGECEALDERHPDWSASWIPENTGKGWERPPGYMATRRSGELVGGDEMRRDPEDGVRRRPKVFAETIPELEERIAAADERIAAEEAWEAQQWKSMRDLRKVR